MGRFAHKGKYKGATRKYLRGVNIFLNSRYIKYFPLNITTVFNAIKQNILEIFVKGYQIMK